MAATILKTSAMRSMRLSSPQTSEMCTGEAGYERNRVLAETTDSLPQENRLSVPNRLARSNVNQARAERSHAERLHTVRSRSTRSLEAARYLDACHDVRRRAIDLLRSEIDFIDNPTFHTPNCADEIDAGEALLAAKHGGASSSKVPQDLPPHLARLCECRLLTHEEEQFLFRKMNFLKYRANSIRVRLDPDALDVVALEYAEADLREARRTRDRIVRANMRLVISVVKKFVTPQISFDDLLSEGIETMMNAVDKFDYDRGFRFSTYAYRSIARHAYRTVTERQRETTRFLTGTDEMQFESVDSSQSSLFNERAWFNLRRLLGDMMGHLDRREQFIIRGRYALGAHRKVRSFQCLADKLGISKERVRQLENRAVNKLRTMAAAHDPDNMIETLTLN